MFSGFKNPIWFVVLFLSQSLYAQRPIGAWSDYLNYRQGLHIDKLQNEVFVGVDNGLFIYNIDDNSVERLSKVNGLSDIGITTVSANDSLKLILLGYENGNIDLIRNRTITNFTAIKNSAIIGDKAIRHVQFFDNKAFLSTGIGIIAYDVERNEVSDTYEILPTGAPSIFQTAVFNDSLFAATSEGLFKASLGTDLTIFSNWIQDISIPEPFTIVNNVAADEGNLYINTRTASNPGVFFRQSGTWQQVNFTGDVIKMTESSGGLTINTSYFINVKNQAGGNSVNFFDYGTNPNMRASQAVFEDGVLWIADTYRGLVRFEPEVGTTEFITPNSPGSNSSFELEIQDGRLWVASGSPAHPGTWGNNFKMDGFYKFYEGSWENYLREELPIMGGEKMFDNPIVYPAPNNPDFAYVGTWYSGLFTAEGGDVLDHFNETNSSLEVRDEFVRPDGKGWVGVGGMRMDDQGNLWLTNGFVDNPMSVLTPEGSWQSFGFSGALGTNQVLTKMIINQEGHLWIVRNRGGVVAYNTNGTIDESDDEVEVFGAGAGNGGLPVEEVYCLGEDLDGEIWVGTADGVAVFFSPFDAFGPDPSDARQILVEQDGIFQFLLEGQSVSCIVADGANRKWIGTFGSGVFLLSEDGTEEVLRFSADNSPLFSDVINDIAINQESGEVFIATEEGIISYQGDATAGELSNECLKVYPNPVRETYSGPIVIEGLMRDSDIRITDMRGNLITSLVSNGGSAVWDGKNTNGQRVATGVYFALSSDAEGNSTCVSEILMIK